MTRITNTDQVLLLLQEQLGRLGKERTTRRGKASAVRGATPEPLARLRALAGREGISDEELRRAVVRSLLVDQLGEALGTDPAFETIAGDVMRIIDASPGGRELIDRAMQQLGAP